jgi:DNA-binding transcriptional ArsR family regulator
VTPIGRAPSSTVKAAQHRDATWISSGSKQLRRCTALYASTPPPHLAPLREQGLVSITPEGRSNVYSMCCEALAGSVKLLATLAAITSEGADACCWG